MTNWIDDLTDEELSDLYDQVLAALYVRAHLRSHGETEREEDVA